MRHAFAFAALAATAALAACGPTVSYHRAPDVTIAPGTTWAWGAEDADGLPDRSAQRVPDDTIARMIRAVVEAELVAAVCARPGVGVATAGRRTSSAS